MAEGAVTYGSLLEWTASWKREDKSGKGTVVLLDRRLFLVDNLTLFASLRESTDPDPSSGRELSLPLSRGGSYTPAIVGDVSEWLFRYLRSETKSCSALIPTLFGEHACEYLEGRPVYRCLVNVLCHLTDENEDSFPLFIERLGLPPLDPITALHFLFNCLLDPLPLPSPDSIEKILESEPDPLSALRSCHFVYSSGGDFDQDLLKGELETVSYGDLLYAHLTGRLLNMTKRAAGGTLPESSKLFGLLIELSINDSRSRLLLGLEQSERPPQRDFSLLETSGLCDLQLRVKGSGVLPNFKGDNILEEFLFRCHCGLVSLDCMRGRPLRPAGIFTSDIKVSDLINVVNTTPDFRFYEEYGAYLCSSSSNPYERFESFCDTSKILAERLLKRPFWHLFSNRSLSDCPFRRRVNIDSITLDHGTLEDYVSFSPRGLREDIKRIESFSFGRITREDLSRLSLLLDLIDHEHLSEELRLLKEAIERSQAGGLSRSVEIEPVEIEIFRGHYYQYLSPAAHDWFNSYDP